MLSWSLAQAAPHLPVSFPPAPPPPDLRQALQQFRPEANPVPTPAPRQLTPAERAQLRRQLSEFAQPAPQPHRR